MNNTDNTIDNNATSNTVNNPSFVDISHIHNFLGTKTSDAWLNAAMANLPLIIQDHANCEKKAASTAMNLLFRYESHQELQLKLSQLIREEMLHYEQVLKIMNDRGQETQFLPAGRYAKGLLKHKRTYEPEALIDVLIIGAFIEARSCERFAALSAVIDNERLAKYYRYLLKSESRHFEDYLALAVGLVTSLNEETSAKIIDERVAFFRDVEAELISSPDEELRFHSGVPVELVAVS